MPPPPFDRPGQLLCPRCDATPVNHGGSRPHCRGVHTPTAGGGVGIVHTSKWLKGVAAGEGRLHRCVTFSTVPLSIPPPSLVVQALVVSPKGSSLVHTIHTTRIPYLLQALVVSSGFLVYSGPREGLVPWLAEGPLGYGPYDAQRHGVAADWVMDLVNIGFRKPRVRGGGRVGRRCVGGVREDDGAGGREGAGRGEGRTTESWTRGVQNLPTSPCHASRPPSLEQSSNPPSPPPLLPP